MRARAALPLLAVLPLLVVLPLFAVAARAEPAVGVRHALEAAMLYPAQDAGQGPQRVDGKDADKTFGVDFYIFVSSHSVQSSVAKQITVHFDRPSRDADDAQPVWRDEACHQRRGYPKVTPVSAEGRIGDVTVMARPRLLGRSLPRDELATQGLVTRQASAGREEARWRVTTTGGLVFALHLTTETCPLDARTPAAP